MRVSVRHVSRHWRIVKVIDALLNVLFIRRERVCLNYRLTVLGVAPKIDRLDSLRPVRRWRRVLSRN